MDKILRPLLLTMVTISVMILSGMFTTSLAQGSSKEFAGTINRTIKIRMRINIRGTSVAGIYFYEKVGQDLQVSGSLNGQELVLNETDASGILTGVFKGKLVTQNLYEGNWSDAKGSRSLPFSLRVLRGPTDAYSGCYRRVMDNGKWDKDSAEIHVLLLSGLKVKIAGEAIWIGNAETGNVNTGSLDEGIFPLKSGKVNYKSGDDEYACKVTITFSDGMLIVTGSDLYCGGMNVSFNGKYKRFGPPDFKSLSE